MLILSCLKCKYPVWFGSLDNIPEGDIGCPICETVQSANACDKHSPNEWRDKVMGTEEDYAIVRNMMDMNYRAIFDKMDLPLFLAEWKVLTMDDMETDDSQELERIFREEARCLLRNVMKRLSERIDDAS